MVPQAASDGLRRPGSPWIRRGEVALLVIGLFLLGDVLVGAAKARISRAHDERVLEVRERIFEPGRALVPGSTGHRAPDPPPPSPDAAVLGRIEIPRVGVSAIVREGDDDATLAVAVGHLPGTSLPGEPGNAVLAGHRDSFFRGLRLIRRGDRIQIRAPGNHLEYRVDSTEIVGPHEMRVVAKTPDDRLTLITCYPFAFVGRAPKRFIVRASPIKQPSLDATAVLGRP